MHAVPSDRARTGSRPLAGPRTDRAPAASGAAGTGAGRASSGPPRPSAAGRGTRADRPWRPPAVRAAASAECSSGSFHRHCGERGSGEENAKINLTCFYWEVSLATLGTNN